MNEENVKTSEENEKIEETIVTLDETEEKGPVKGEDSSSIYIDAKFTLAGKKFKVKKIHKKDVTLRLIS